jgi:hypothetical protein
VRTGLVPDVEIPTDENYKRFSKVMKIEVNNYKVIKDFYWFTYIDYYFFQKLPKPAKSAVLNAAKMRSRYRKVINCEPVWDGLTLI